MNILTIDFDIIMSQNIDLYNDVIRDDLTINHLSKEYEILNFLKADLKIYDKLTKFIMEVIKTVDSNNIFFIKNHDTIIKYIGNEQFNLWNIDHHHDITYDKTNPLLPVLQCTCGNWIKYLMDYNKIQKYVWISDYKGVPADDVLQSQYPHQHLLLNDFNLIDLINNVDKIFICKSPEWVPEYYYPLFDTWISICENYYNKQFKLL